MTITIRSVFEEGGKLYIQVFLDDTFSRCMIKHTCLKHTSRKATYKNARIRQN